MYNWNTFKEFLPENRHGEFMGDREKKGKIPLSMFKEPWKFATKSKRGRNGRNQSRLSLETEEWDIVVI